MTRSLSANSDPAVWALASARMTVDFVVPVRITFIETTVLLEATRSP